MSELVGKIEELGGKIANTWKVLDIDGKKTEIKALEKEMNEVDFWKDQDNAQKVSKRLSDLKDEVGEWEVIKEEVNDVFEIAKLDQEDKEVSLREDLEKKYAELEDHFKKLEFNILFSGKYDRNDAIFAIHAGTGGTEAQDWAEMLLRMMLRYCEKKGYKTRIIDESRGTEAGIKSVTVEANGRWAYGYLRSEAGVHRLVRISPFDAEKMRHTSFALIEVLPVLEEIKEVEIDPKDLRIDTFLSSGHGGQGVQTTYSAVRVVHIPTGLMATCQNERSQQQNKETAMKILRGKLHRLYEEERDEEKKKIRGEYSKAQWGNQIRSYVLHPYKMVKDHRTKHETSDTEAVLDGELDDFAEAYLRWDRKNKK